jgi:hypothetical protein
MFLKCLPGCVATSTVAAESAKIRSNPLALSVSYGLVVHYSWLGISLLRRLGIPWRRRLGDNVLLRVVDWFLRRRLIVLITHCVYGCVCDDDFSSASESTFIFVALNFWHLWLWLWFRLRLRHFRFFGFNV